MNKGRPDGRPWPCGPAPDGAATWRDFRLTELLKIGLYH